MVIDIDRNDNTQEYCLQLLTNMINADQSGQRKDKRKTHLFQLCFFEARQKRNF